MIKHASLRIVKVQCAGQQNDLAPLLKASLKLGVKHVFV